MDSRMAQLLMSGGDARPDLAPSPSTTPQPQLDPTQRFNTEGLALHNPTTPYRASIPPNLQPCKPGQPGNLCNGATCPPASPPTLQHTCT